MYFESPRLAPHALVLDSRSTFPAAASLSLQYLLRDVYAESPRLAPPYTLKTDEYSAVVDFIWASRTLQVSTAVQCRVECILQSMVHSRYMVSCGSVRSFDRGRQTTSAGDGLGDS